MARAKENKRWTPEEHEEYLRLTEKGWGPAQIGRKMSRTTGSINAIKNALKTGKIKIAGAERTGEFFLAENLRSFNTIAELNHHIEFNGLKGRVPVRKLRTMTTVVETD